VVIGVKVTVKDEAWLENKVRIRLKKKVGTQTDFAVLIPVTKRSRILF